METTPQKLEMFYEGKAKKLYSTSDPDLVIAYFKDDATAFNGKKRDTIEDKGVMNNRISELFFLLLEKNGAVHTAIIGVGGFLGAGEKNVAVPFAELKLREKNGQRYLVMNTTKEALESAPGYTYDRSANQWISVSKQG